MAHAAVMMTTEQRRARTILRCLSGLILPALAGTAEAQSFVPPIDEVGTPEQTADSELPASLPAIYAWFEGLTGDEFEGAVRSLLSARIAPTLDAVILRAGAHVPPGLTAARTATRETMRAEALVYLQGEIDAELTADGRWQSRLSQLLVTQVAGDDLWCAAALTAAAVGRYDLAESIALGLSSERSARVRGAARDALYTLYLKHFETEEDFDAFWSAANVSSREPLVLLSTLRDAREVARAQYLRLIELEPTEAITALTDTDCVIRTAAANILVRNVGSGTVPAATVIEAFLGRLGHEVDARVFHTMLDSLLQLLAGLDANATSVTNLRSVLDSVADARHRQLEWSVANALGRIEWDETAESGPASLGQGIARVADLFSRSVRPGEALDSDLLVQGLENLRSLASRAGPPSSSLAARTRAARDAVLFLLLDAERSEEVRLAAAKAASIVIGETDVDRLVEALREEGTSVALRFELVGSLGRIATGLEPGGDSAARVMNALLDSIRDDDADLRGSALDVIASEAMRPLLQVTDPALLVQRLDRERDQELQSRLLELIARFERPELVDSILGLQGFNDLMQGNPRRMSELASTLAQLAGDNEASIYRSAAHFLLLPDPDTRIVRLEHALGLVTGLPSEVAFRLGPEQHHAVVRWALELRRSYGSQAGGGERMAQFLPALTSVHVPRCSLEEGIDERALAHTTALLAGDHLISTNADGDPTLVLGFYLEALAYAFDPAPGVQAESPSIVRRDRARFLLAVGRPSEALNDLRSLLAFEASAGESSEEDSALSLSDLRTAADLLGDPATGHTIVPKSAAGEAFDISYSLVERSTWRNEPVRVRFDDLRDMAERSLASATEARFAKVRAMLGDLPELPAEGTYETGSSEPPAEGEPDPLWRGLLRDRANHETLGELLRRIPAAPAAEKTVIPAGAGRQPEEG